MAQSIKLNYFYNTLLNISKVVFPLITAPYVSRVLEPDGIGLFNFSNSFAEYFALFAALGVPLYGVREIAKMKDNLKKQNEFVSEIMSITVISTILFSILSFCTIVFLPRLKENLIIFLVASFTLYITPFRIDWFFSGKEDFGYITARSLIVKFFSIILLFVLVRDKSDLLIYVSLNAACQVVNEMWNFCKLYKLGIHPHFTLKVKRHIKPLLYLLSSSIAVSIYLILDTLMLGVMKNLSEVGYYNSATHVSRAILPIVTSFSIVALPKISKYKEVSNWKEINRIANMSLSLILYISIPVVMGVVAIAPQFVPLFFGSLFYEAILPLQIVITTIIAIGINNLLGIQILVGFGFDKLFLISVIMGALSNFILNLVMIPKFGAAGAAFSSVFAEFLIVFIMLHLIYRFTPVRFNRFKEFTFNVCICSSFFVITHFVSFVAERWVYILLSIICCSSFYVLMQWLIKNPSEILIIKNVEKKIKEYKRNF